jgi:hypothetical protein
VSVFGSDAEEALAWQVRTLGLSKPAREHEFARPRRWRFDFAWPSWKIAVEVQGGSWISGRHSRGDGFERDCEKLAEAQLLGWIVLPVTPAMVDDGRALALLERRRATGDVRCTTRRTTR